MTETQRPPTALVVGGGGGIGSAVARALARDGYSVVLTYLSDKVRAETAAAEISPDGRRSAAVELDATSSAHVDDLFARLAADGRLTCVVHCPGAWTFTRLTELTDAEIDQAIDLNLKSGLYVLRAAGRHLADGGAVVTVSSAAVGLAPTRHASYVATKAGIEAASRVAAKEFGARGIRVNVVRPGATDTARLRASTSPKAIEAMSTGNVLRRLGTPEDIADVIAFLCSDRGRWVTGSVLDVAGGIR